MGRFANASPGFDCFSHRALPTPAQTTEPVAQSCSGLRDGRRARHVSGTLPTLVMAAAACSAISAAAVPCAAQQLEPAQQLVREVVYNELHDHDAHGFWRYWIRQTVPDGTHTVQVVESPAGPIQRLVLCNGRPVDSQNQQVEDAKLEELASSPSQQASHRQSYAEDENRVRRVMAMLPDAFSFEDLGEQNGIRHLRFQPNPSYSAHTVEARIFHALNGDLYIDARMKRMARLEGHLNDDVNFGLGILGRVNKGSWFRMQRRQVSATEWKTDRLDVHISGRAILFKTIAHETSEVRGGFTRVPDGFTVTQSVHLLERSNAETVAAEFKQVSLIGGGQ